MRVPTSGGPPIKILEVPADSAEFNCPYSSAALCILSRQKHDRLVFYRLDPIRGLAGQAAVIKLKPQSKPFWSLSPDGSRIAAVTDSTAPAQIQLLDLKDSTNRILVVRSPRTRILQANWTADGNSLVASGFEEPNSFIVHIELDGSVHTVFNVGKDHILLSPPLASPDGRYLAFNRLTWESNAWLLENF